jgi:hypothetical protein
MTISQQTQQERIDLTATAVGGGFFGSLLGALGAGLQGLGRARVTAIPTTAAPEPSSKMSELFARAICENSNSALDWLYYAAQLSSPDERRYCAYRALQIDPTSELVRQELRRIRWM